MKRRLKYIRGIFDDWLTRAAGIILILIVSLVIFNAFSDSSERHPLFGLFNFSMVPVLFIIGGVIFVISILRSSVADTEKIVEHSNQHRFKLLFLVFSGVIGISLMVVGGYQLVEFMDSNAFCGQLCHRVMYPEYTTYQVSPHSRVDCVECHVGSGASYLVKSKVSGVPQIIATIFNSYPTPIPTPVENLRPARETCEQCHRPEKFSGDLVRYHHSYALDESNTESIDTRIFKVGGGESGVAKDIHWHIGANVWYLSTDKERDDIIWLAMENADGELIIYVDPDNADQATSQRLNDGKRLMDCMDCHNRATHIFYSAEELIDTALTQGKIDSSLPFIKREGLEALDPVSSSLEDAISKVESIDEFYKNNYTDIYDEKNEAIDKALIELKEIARLTTFPDMEVSWETHLDNVSHQGCSRCHGKLVAVTGDQKGETIGNSCTLCHNAL